MFAQVVVAIDNIIMFFCCIWIDSALKLSYFSDSIF